MNNRVGGFRKIKTLIEFLKSELDHKIDFYHEVLLFDHLLGKLSEEDERDIVKINVAFALFINKNKDGILNRDFSLFEEKNLEITSKIILDFQKIFLDLKEEGVEKIWFHFWWIASFLVPQLNTKEILKEKYHNQMFKEDALISKLADKINANSDGMANHPMLATLQMIQNGTFTELMQDVQEGIVEKKMKPEKLLGSVQNLLETHLDEDQLDQVNTMVKTLFSTFAQNTDTNSEDLLKNLLPTLGNMKLPTIKEMDESKKEDE